jgi:hypothetical protein
MNLRGYRITMTAFVLGMLLETSILARPKPGVQTAIPLPERQIDLSALNFVQPKNPNYKNSEIFSNLSLLFQDVHAHVEFIDDKELVVYFSEVVDERLKAQNGQPPPSPPAHRMEALFLDLETGNLISHEVWQTRERRFFNTRYDTQAQIMPVRAGFLVHAGDTLTLYAPDLTKKREMQLNLLYEYAATVAPGGDVFFLQEDNPGTPIRSGVVSMVMGDNVAHGDWRSSETLQKLRGRDLFPGAAESVSTNAFAGKWYSCIDIQGADSTQSHLCCDDPCRYGSPVFLDDRQVVSSFRGGFRVLSTQGEVLWAREDPDWKTYKDGDVWDKARSLDGSRFAELRIAYRKLKFDDTQIPKQGFGVLVYDRSRRTKVFSVVFKPELAPTIALSPTGDLLAILSGTTLLLYRIPDTTTPD